MESDNHPNENGRPVAAFEPLAPTRRSSAPDGWSRLSVPALAITAPLAPILMIAGTFAFYIGGMQGAASLVAGFLTGTIVWFGAAILARPHMSVDRANRSVYRELVARVTNLKSQIETSNESIDNLTPYRGIHSKAAERSLKPPTHLTHRLELLQRELNVPTI
jgi:hypothetical protein